MSTVTLPPHGTLHRRKTYGCKCDPCRDRDREYTNTRTRLIAYGRWQPYIDANPIRAHVRMLMSYGIGWQRVCRLSGVANGSVSRLLYGDKNRGYQLTKRVRSTTAEKILAIRPDISNVAPAALVDATGTRRRLQALVANGWPQMRLGAELGITHYRLVWERIRGETVTGASARDVMALYNRLWNVDPADFGVAPRFIAQARKIARAHGWAPPAAWDDDTIDSPAAEPNVGDKVPRYVALAEDGLWLEAQGYTRQQAADRLGVTRDALQKSLERWRRVQAEHDAEQQDDAGEAAA